MGILMRNEINYSGNGSSSSTISSSSVNYSTEEQVIGTWIDGRPLYQKTFYYENYALENGYNYLSTDLENIEIISEIKGSILSSSGTNIFPINTYLFTEIENSTFVAFDVSNNRFVLTTKAIWSSPTINITIQYTKTTDTTT